MDISGDLVLRYQLNLKTLLQRHLISWKCLSLSDLVIYDTFQNYRMQSVSCQLQDMYKESVIQFNSNKSLISSLDTRITKLEEHMHKILGLLEKLCETGNESKGGHTRLARSVSVSDVELNGK